MTVKVDELEQGPTVMMRKGQDRERGRGRRDRDDAGGNTGFGGGE
jgi:small subunit ribosomal protein S6